MKTFVELTNKYDKIMFGALIGLIAPIIAFFLIYFFKFNSFEFSDFLKHITSNKDKLFAPLFSLSGIANLFVFFYLISNKRYMLKAGKGVILSTFILVVVVVYFKFL